jgi:hypothetical protein
VLDDVERRRFLVQPTGEDAAPAPVGLLHVELNEGAGQLLVLPRGGGLAGAQPHDHVLPADRLTGMQRDILDDAVALVEDAEHRHPLRHRRHTALAVRGRGDLLSRRQRLVLRFPALPARGERERGKQWCSGSAHAYSGIQGS